MKNIIFLRIAWMQNYGGMDNDEIDSDVSWIKEHGYCYEMFNFRENRGEFLGFVEPKGSIRIDRLDINTKSTDEYIDDVTVVWVATSPTGGTFVIGWYLNATIFRRTQMPPADSHRVFEGNKISYNVRAKIKGCVLLDINQRTISVPTGKGGIGQSNIWYADDKNNPNHHKYKVNINSFINEYYKDNKFHCKCGAWFPCTSFTKGKSGKCLKCGEVITIPQNTKITIPQFNNNPTVEKTLLPPTETPTPLVSTKNEPKIRSKVLLSPDKIYEQAIKSVVGIQHDNGAGSGVLVNRSGLIITNRHVIYGNSREITVELDDTTTHKAKILRYYRDLDIAFLKIQKENNNSLKIKRDVEIKVGQHVFAIGNPLGHKGVFTDGLISQLEQEVGGRHYMLISAPLEPGNSGGPLLNEYGELIGINTMGRSGTTVMNFAININDISNKYNIVEEKCSYLENNYFCHICGNTSYNTDYCDHCGVEINTSNNKKNDDSYVISCPECEFVADGDITTCPNCSKTITR